jgi:outer membrane biosynthesis protein TonB
MGLVWGRRLTAVALSLWLAVGVAIGQQTTEEGKRKVKTRVNPQFSDLAKRMNISGKVRIEVVIAPDGHVKNARALGGHPVLVQPCLDALYGWKYETAPEESTLIVEFEVKAQQ